MPREAALATRTDRLLTERGAWWVNLHGSVMGATGLPDRLAIHRGRALAIELKSPRGQLRARQRFVLERIRRAGGIVVVAKDLAAIAAALDDIEATA